MQRVRRLAATSIICGGDVRHGAIAIGQRG
jgi:hypothetical protein